MSENVAEISSVAAGITRPLWSVLIPTFNCGQYLREAMESVLAQDPGPSRMEIIVVDDHSLTDDPADLVTRIAGSRVRVIRQSSNVGKVRNYETGLNASTGLLIHQLHCDDRVRAGFYDAFEKAFSAFPEAGAFFCEANYIDSSGSITGRTGRELSNVGILDHWLEKIVVRQRIQTPSMVTRREVYERVGGFDRRLDSFEDWEMWIRIAQFVPVGFIPETLADYRITSGNTTARSFLDGSHVVMLRKVLEIVEERLPAGVLSRCANDRDKAMAEYLSHSLPLLLKGRHFGAAARLYRDVLTFSHDPQTLRKLASTTIRSTAAQR